MRGETYIFEHTKYHMEAKIGTGELGWTGYFINNKFVKTANLVDNRVIDWALFQTEELKQNSD